MADFESFLLSNSSAQSTMVSDDLTQPNLVNASMQECLARANSDGRLVVGFKDVIECLEKLSPDKILLCILPENLWNDQKRTAMFHLVVTLCYSHCVRMIKVDDDQLVRKIIDRTSASQSEKERNLQSYECMLVLQSQPALACDLQLLRYHSRFADNDFNNLPMIRLSEY